MKQTPDKRGKQSREKERTGSDNLCKRLAEKYPEQFVQWVFDERAGEVKVMKTQLSREPIRADSAIRLSTPDEIFHAEFQTLLKSRVPLPLRMLDYYVGFKRANPNKNIRQALIILKETGETILNFYEDVNTYHRFTVIKMWEQEPQKLMTYEGLLPLAVLCRADSGEELLKEVAAKIGRIKSKEQRRETLGESQMLAGLRYDRGLIYQIFKESNMIEESVIYQDIIEKGLQQGLQQGEIKLLMRQLTRRFGKLSTKVCKQIEKLNIEELENLGEALLDFKTKAELIKWLNEKVTVR